MNAEDCAIHRPMIDQPGGGGIYYPWICPCNSSLPHDCDNCLGIDPESCPFNEGRNSSES